MRLWLLYILPLALAGCVSSAEREPVQILPPANVPSAGLPAESGGRHIVYNGAGGFVLPDGTSVVADATGGFTLPNGSYAAPDGAGGIILPNGTRCVSDGARGYRCP
jgi:hypothetical protein